MFHSSKIYSLCSYRFVFGLLPAAIRLETVRMVTNSSEEEGCNPTYILKLKSLKNLFVPKRNLFEKFKCVKQTQRKGRTYRAVKLCLGCSTLQCNSDALCTPKYVYTNSLKKKTEIDSTVVHYNLKEPKTFYRNLIQVWD